MAPIQYPTQRFHPVGSGWTEYRKRLQGSGLLEGRRTGLKIMVLMRKCRRLYKTYQAQADLEVVGQLQRKLTVSIRTQIASRSRETRHTIALLFDSLLSRVVASKSQD